MATNNRIEEIVNKAVEAGKQRADWFEPSAEVILATTAKEQMLKAHQAGIEEAETQTLQEIMDDLTLLHKRKEIDDNGFCTVRDLLHSKALQDNK